MNQAHIAPAPLGPKQRHSIVIYLATICTRAPGASKPNQPCNEDHLRWLRYGTPETALFDHVWTQREGCLECSLHRVRPPLRGVIYTASNYRPPPHYQHQYLFC
ncbi:hypothetical protein DPEC_G00358920 [Dallia pectoralis]|uniref:Uncharacterized protein n=1 Tax=Dallia pectoralis TaxID=75939 RepID=A0ACC2F0G8_DALPE|nr:hypothetical protein DPEC_G00358920 [Dallia pectoralis]